jgi:tetratricopeptide (TPR) repeat protein
MIKLFISYSHSDELFKEKLEKHLTLLKRNKIIETWHDRKIIPGQEWDLKIKEELDSADVILLLISIDFLNSDYCYDVEIKKAIQKHENKEAVLIPIILRACSWQETEFGKIQALPKNGSPVTTFRDEDEAYHSISEGIKLAIENLKSIRISAIPEKRDNDVQVNIIHKQKKECDTPPNNSFWTGRLKEIEELSSDLHKVVFISGIGGQGKSGLASYYIKEIVPHKGNWEFWDWRDCQEKEDRIHTKIISIICRLSNNTIQPNQISDEKIDDLIELLFLKLEKRKIVFVFDNIDAYIEFENFQLIGTVDKLFKAAIKESHNSKFIFTCRSTLNEIHPELLDIRLTGLSKDDTEILFKKYDLNLSQDQTELLISKSFELTKGHPLWLNLIAAQARRGFSFAEKFIFGIKANATFQEENLTSILSNKILNVIWDDLNDKQKTLLRVFAETVRSETLENLSKIISSELNHNQFIKSFNVLKRLNLVVIKTDNEESDTFELHPLVREYIIQNYGRNERSKYISLFVNFFDNIILILKPKLSSEQPFSFFENWTAKVELDVNDDNYKNALISLEEISYSICEAGYVEEYIRVSNLLFINIDWANAINEEYSYFHTQLSKFLDIITDFGKLDQANAFLIKYKKHITNKGINYIRYCKAKSHYHWFLNEFNEAIEIANEGLELNEPSITKFDIDLDYSLALSLRDTKIKDNVAKALEIFSKESDLVKIINSKEDLHISGEMYGNVGRCLHFLGREEDAIKCFKKSVKSLNLSMNKGYGYFWISEILIQTNDLSTGIRFLIQTRNIWKKFSPIKANMIQRKIDAIVELNPVYSDINSKDERSIEKFCVEWIK